MGYIFSHKSPLASKCSTNKWLNYNFNHQISQYGLKKWNVFWLKYQNEVKIMEFPKLD